MPYTLTVPDGYGFSAAIALGVIPLISLIQGVVVTTLRKPAGVTYPNCYATPEQSKTNPKAYQFNCAQRAHANLLENMPQTIACILFSGLFYPRATPVLGAVWALSRIAFAYGYIASDKPKGSGRMIGAPFWLAQFSLFGLSIASAMKLL